MTIKTPPVDWDRHAQVVARHLAGMDASRLPGKKTQFTAIVHEAIVDAMMMAAEDAEAKLRDCAKTQTGGMSGRLSECGGESRPLAQQTHAHQRPDVAGNGQQEHATC